MAFPTTSGVDDFNRSDGSDLGANWDFAFNFGNSSNIFNIASNRAIPSGNHYAEEVHTTTCGPDCEVWVTLVTVPASGADYGVIGRYSGSGGTAAGYRLAITHNTGSWQVARVVSGNSSTSVGSSTTQAVGAGDSYGLEITGTGATVSIGMYYKASGGSWTLLSTVTDTSGSRITTSGKIGTYMYRASGSGGAIDDFGGGTQTAGGVFVPDRTLIIPNAAVVRSVTW